MSTDPARLLLLALRRSARDASCTVELAHDGETPWASATFVGTRFTVGVTGTALDGWLATLADADLPIRGHFVASLEVGSTSDGAILTVLVLEA